VTAQPIIAVHNFPHPKTVLADCQSIVQCRELSPRKENFMPPLQRLAVPTLLIAAGLLSGCGSKDPLVGKWSGNLPGPAGTSLQMATEFKGDGTQTQTLNAMGQNVVIQSTWVAKDGTLTETMTSAMRNGQTMPFPGRTETFSYKIDGDTLTLNQPKSPSAFVLQRQK
jgi:hypothetical protein